MPISAIDNCSVEHWEEVRVIIQEAIKAAGFEPNLVSDGDEIGVIQKRIIQNIYTNPIIVCDISGKNPNVMFELGMRLAFDKPTIIIKDDKTEYIFDTSVIEHISYPRDLRFQKINTFKQKLSEKIKATYAKAKSDPKYSTFLKNFGNYKIAEIEEREVTSDKYLIESIEELKLSVSDLRVKFNSLNSSIRSENSEYVKALAIDYMHDCNCTMEELFKSKLNFVKYIKDRTALGLKESKDIADEFFSSFGH